MRSSATAPSTPHQRESQRRLVEPPRLLDLEDRLERLRSIAERRFIGILQKELVDQELLPGSARDRRVPGEEREVLVQRGITEAEAPLGAHRPMQPEQLVVRERRE